MNTSSSSLQAIEVPDDERVHILPKHFGRHMLRVEYAIYTFMAELAASYDGAFWKFVELSNGGFYMVPMDQITFDIRVEGWVRRCDERGCRRSWDTFCVHGCRHTHVEDTRDA